MRIARKPSGFHVWPSATPAVKVRQYARYSLRTGSQKARFSESKAPSVITGLSLAMLKRMPSADLSTYSPCGLPTMMHL